MGFITRCPACGTAFKVVPDQLKISDGWVRCGHCADVFDATLYLDMLEPAARQESTPVPPVADPPSPREDDADWLVMPSPEPSPPAVPVAEPSAAAHGIDVLLDHEPEPLTVPPGASWSSGPIAERSAADSLLPGADDFHAELAAFAAAARPEPETGSAQNAAEPFVVPQKAVMVAAVRPPGIPSVPETPPASAVTSVTRPPSASEGERHAPVAAEPGFVRQARKQAFWRLPVVRSGLLVGALLLGMALLTQVAVHERDRWAAAYPGLRPWLETLCKPWQCAIQPLQHLDAVVIESSSLVRRVGDMYGFELVLKNNASAAVAMPALELSLTDLRDQVLARRVFLPAELPGRPESLAPGARLPVTLSLKLAQEPTTAMTGYRALVFYP